MLALRPGFARWFTLILVAGCGSNTIGTSRQIDDTGVSAGASGVSSSTGGTGTTGGFGGAGGSSGGEANGTDASSDDGSPDAAISCSSSGPSVTNVLQTRGPPPPASDAAGGTPPVSGTDAGRLPGLPSNPCADYPAPDCPAGPRAIFACPIVSGPGGASTIHPGDQITVTVPITDEGLAAYSCFGLSGDQPVMGGAELFYAVKPGYVRMSGQLAPSTKPGTVIHFRASADGTAYVPAAGTACSGDLTRLDFDVTVQ